MTQPFDGTNGDAWRPGTSGHQLAREGGVVVKHFGARLGAFAREGALLARLGALADAPPVPRLLPARRFGELRYAYVDGVTGTEAIAAGLAGPVLGAMGAALRRLHALDPEPLADVLPGAGPVVAHGDFAPTTCSSTWRRGRSGPYSIGRRRGATRPRSTWRGARRRCWRASPTCARRSCEALAWAAPAAEGSPRRVYLTEGALRATAVRFGVPPAAEPVRIARVPARCELLYGAGAVPAWGADEARRRLAACS